MVATDASSPSEATAWTAKMSAKRCVILRFSKGFLRHSRAMLRKALVASEVAFLAACLMTLWRAIGLARRCWITSSLASSEPLLKRSSWGGGWAAGWARSTALEEPGPEKGGLLQGLLRGWMGGSWAWACCWVEAAVPTEARAGPEGGACYCWWDVTKGQSSAGCESCKKLRWLGNDPGLTQEKIRSRFDPRMDNKMRDLTQWRTMNNDTRQ